MSCSSPSLANGRSPQRLTWHHRFVDERDHHLDSLDAAVGSLGFTANREYDCL